MKKIALEKAQAILTDLLRQVADGDEIIITQNGEPKARLCAVPSSYFKNGILVHHTMNPISSEDVAQALGGE